VSKLEDNLKMAKGLHETFNQNLQMAKVLHKTSAELRREAEALIEQAGDLRLKAERRRSIASPTTREERRKGTSSQS
jgi:hypothetical protein